MSNQTITASYRKAVLSAANSLVALLAEVGYVEGPLPRGYRIEQEDGHLFFGHPPLMDHNNLAGAGAALAPMNRFYANLHTGLLGEIRQFIDALREPSQEVKASEIRDLMHGFLSVDRHPLEEAAPDSPHPGSFGTYASRSEGAEDVWNRLTIEGEMVRCGDWITDEDADTWTRFSYTQNSTGLLFRQRLSVLFAESGSTRVVSASVGGKNHIPQDARERDDLRGAVAELAFQNYHMGDDVVGETSGWETTTPDREWSRSVFLENPRGGDSTRHTFTVTFTTNDSADVEDVSFS